MPMLINCANFPNCLNLVAKLGDLCPDCAERVRVLDARRWMGEGFPKWFDNQRGHGHPNGRKPKEPK